MTPLALLFMVVSWALVLGLTAWSYRRVLRASAQKLRATDRAQDPPMP